jgi:hypothetical protein
MARSVFFSFHYQRDIWRVNQIRSIPNVTGCAAAGFRDGSLWEEAKKKGDAEIKKLIDGALKGTTVTVVFIGAKTAGRKYINYEIDQSVARGNGLIGVQIHHLKNENGDIDTKGDVPARLTAAKAPIYSYTDKDDLAKWVEKAAKAAGH